MAYESKQSSDLSRSLMLMPVAGYPALRPRSWGQPQCLEFLPQLVRWV